MRRITFDLLKDFDNFVDEYKCETEISNRIAKQPIFNTPSLFFLRVLSFFFYFFILYIWGGLLVPVDVTVHTLIMGGLSNNHFEMNPFHVLQVLHHKKKVKIMEFFFPQFLNFTF